MPLPASLTTRTLHGQWVKADGTYESGTVTYKTTYYIRVPVDNVVMSPATFTATMNATGEITIANVPVNDDPDGAPNSGAYTETVVYSDMRTTTRNIVVSKDDPSTIEVADKPDAQVTVPFSSYATLDGTGNVPASQLGNVVGGGGSVTSVAGRTGAVVLSTADIGSGVFGTALLPNATSGAPGIVQLAGDLSGTYTSPTVPGLANKVGTTGNETIAGIKDFSSSPTVPTPTTGTQAANKTYVDAYTPPDATTGVKGVVKLAGDLAGTALLPTVPGLTSKAATTTTVSAGGALTGGGDLSANRTITLATDAVDNTYLANMVQSTIKGRAAAAGTGDPTDLTAAQVTAIVTTATTGALGLIQLAGDLAGTGTSPTVPGLANKTDTTRTISTTAPLTGGGDLSANRTFAVSDATTGAKGVIQLAGDLGGTAAAPTVPNLPLPSSSLPTLVTTGGTAGSATTYSRSDHQHPSRELTADDYGLIAWNFPSVNCAGGQALPTAGTIQTIRVNVPVATTITNIVMVINAAGSALTSGQCFAALANSAKTVLSTTADQSTPWASTGVKVMALGTPQAVAAGTYYIAVFFNGTTGPAFGRTGTVPGAGNLSIAAASSFHATADTGRTTTMPASLGAFTASSTCYFGGLS